MTFIDPGRPYSLIGTSTLGLAAPYLDFSLSRYGIPEHEKVDPDTVRHQ
jgi:hypothetical protein